MKKSLIAIAALAATGAFAQSSVTLYGVADLSLAKTSGVSSQLSGNGTLNNGSSRFGLRGSEDLGGGLKANFNFEAGVNAETGATDAAMFQRAAYAELAGGFGSVRMGRTLSPSFYGVAAWELTGTANYSVVASQFGWAGAGPRNNSQISYTTPNMSGFSGTLGCSTTFGQFALTLDIARDTGFKDTNTLVEAKYALSKRTFVYGAFLRDGKGKTATSTNTYGVGVRHNF